MNNFEFLQDIIKKNWIAIISILFGISSIIGSICYITYFYECPSCESIKEGEIIGKADEENKEQRVQTLKVDVKGAIKTPGVYEMDNSATILDAIEAAGGITSKGTTSNINLSRKLTDEMVIYIFTKDELKKAESNKEIVCEIPKCECETITVNECIDKNKPTSSSSNNENNKPNNNKISINTSSIEELSTLEGIGESKAQAIISYRTINGPFKTIEDLKLVNGIGEAIFEKIKENITI